MSKAMISAEAMSSDKAMISTEAMISDKAMSSDKDITSDKEMSPDKDITSDKEMSPELPPEGIYHPVALYMYYDYNNSTTYSSSIKHIIPIPVKSIGGIKGIELDIFLEITYSYKLVELVVKSLMTFDDDGNLSTYFKQILLFHYNYSDIKSEDSNKYNYTMEDFTFIYNRCNELLPKLHFNKLTGEIEKNDIDTKEIQSGHNRLAAIEAWNADLQQYDTIELIYKECSTCFDLTKTITHCKHPLCIICWETICWTDDDVATHICPCCRKELNNEHWDSDSNSSNDNAADNASDNAAIDDNAAINDNAAIDDNAKIDDSAKIDDNGYKFENDYDNGDY